MRSCLTPSQRCERPAVPLLAGCKPHTTPSPVFQPTFPEGDQACRWAGHPSTKLCPSSAHTQSCTARVEAVGAWHEACSCRPVAQPPAVGSRRCRKCGKLALQLMECGLCGELLAPRSVPERATHAIAASLRSNRLQLQRTPDCRDGSLQTGTAARIFGVRNTALVRFIQQAALLRGLLLSPQPPQRRLATQWAGLSVIQWRSTSAHLSSGIAPAWKPGGQVRRKLRLLGAPRGQGKLMLLLTHAKLS